MITPDRTPAQSSSDLEAARVLAVAARYRRTQVYGLLLIAAAILAVTLFRAEPHLLFVPGWWR
jgi:t-SNARE complex subunit (syntaxin)